MSWEDHYIKFVDKYCDLLDFSKISWSGNVGNKLYTKYKDKKWDRRGLAATAQRDLFEENPEEVWYENCASINDNIRDLKIITVEQEVNESRFNPEHMLPPTAYPHPQESFDIEFINNCVSLGLEINWRQASVSRAVKMKDILDHPEYDWVYEYVSQNPNVTLDMVVNKRPAEDWSWYYVCMSKNVFYDPKKPYPWDYEALSRNPNITLDWIKPHPEKWDFFWMSLNEGLTFDIIDAYYDRFEFSFISNNVFKRERERFAIIKIQDWWFNIIANPYHPVGKKYLLRKAKEVCDF